MRGHDDFLLFQAFTEVFLVLTDFSLTVKAATLIFISGRGSAISSAYKRKQVLLIIWLRIDQLFGSLKRACIS